MEDIKKYEEDCKLDNDLGKEIERYFKELTVSFTGTKKFDEFSLEEEGPIVVLEVEDDLANLEGLGLTQESGGIFSTVPESVETLQIGDKSYYRIIVICNNSYGLVFCSRVNEHGIRFENWLKKFL
jgi:hypothetical protein